MKNAKSMREELIALYNDLRSGKIEPKVASELTSICQTMNASAVAQVNYYRQRREAPKIEFLDEA